MSYIDTIFPEHYRPRQWLSVSDLVNFRRCPRKFFYQTGCCFSPGEQPALAFGEAMHAAFPVASTEGFDAAYKAFVGVWGTKDADEKRNNTTAARILQDYVNSREACIYRLEKPKNPLRFSSKVSEFEYMFRLDIGMHVPLVGRMDGLARLKNDNSLWVLEYKTTSELTGRFFEAFQLSPQICCYVLYARSAIMEEPVVGAIVEGIRVSSANSAILANPIWVKDFQLDAFVLWARGLAAQIKTCEDNKCFPEDYAGCHPYAQFGSPGYSCNYMPLCQQEDPSILLPQLYSKVEDRPYDILVNGMDPSKLDRGQCTSPKKLEIESGGSIFQA